MAGYVKGKSLEATDNLLKFDKTKILINNNPGPKYLTMTRTDDLKSMETVSPFLLKKIIDTVWGGTKMPKIKGWDCLNFYKKFETGRNFN